MSMETAIRKLSGANMDIDLVTPEDEIEWPQDRCPWNQAEGIAEHQCAVKNISLCQYFRGVEYLDIVLCSYPIQEPASFPYAIQGPLLETSDRCAPILQALPEWFGIEEAVQEYIEVIQQCPTYLAHDADRVVGFLTIKQHFSKAAEVYVTGVLPDYHRQGLGRALLQAAESDLRQQGIEYLQVKTLSASHPDEGYARTRAFYLSVGFQPLEEFKTLWGEANPALLLVKKL